MLTKVQKMSVLWQKSLNHREVIAMSKSLKFFVVVLVIAAAVLAFRSEATEYGYLDRRTVVQSMSLGYPQLENCFSFLTVSYYYKRKERRGASIKNFTGRGRFRPNFARGSDVLRLRKHKFASHVPKRFKRRFVCITPYRTLNVPSRNSLPYGYRLANANTVVQLLLLAPNALSSGQHVFTGSRTDGGQVVIVGKEGGRISLLSNFAGTGSMSAIELVNSM